VFQNCEMLKIRYCLDSLLTDGGKIVSLTRRPSYIPPESFFSVSDNHFLLVAEETPGASTAGMLR
jgi:hypothetical protein